LAAHKNTIMCSPRKYPYLPHGREFFKIPSVGGVWIFSGTEQYKIECPGLSFNFVQFFT